MRQFYRIIFNYFKTDIDDNIVNIRKGGLKSTDSRDEK